jgi:DedD protein
MALPPLFKRRTSEASESAAAVDATELKARTRARRRLIGAAVLLVAGVIAFPLLFETQPRPIPVDIPMVIPSRDGAPALAPPARATRSASGVVADAPAAAAVTADAAPAAVAPVAPPPVPEKPVEKPHPKPAEKPAERAPEKQAEAKAPAKGRYVVQVGAYADDASTREVRQKVERLGLKTYTQAVDVGGSRRIRVRVGPFDTMDEAQKAAAALKAAKLPAALLTL